MRSFWRYLGSFLGLTREGVPVYGAGCKPSGSGSGPFSVLPGSGSGSGSGIFGDRRVLARFLGFTEDGIPIFGFSECDFPQIGRYLCSYLGMNSRGFPVYGLSCCDERGFSGTTGPLSGASGMSGDSGFSGYSGVSSGFSGMSGVPEGSSGISGSSGTSGVSGSSGPPSPPPIEDCNQGVPMLDGSGNVFGCQVQISIDVFTLLSWNSTLQLWDGNGYFYCFQTEQTLLYFRFDRYGRLYYSCDLTTWSQAEFVSRSGTTYSFLVHEPCGCPEHLTVEVSHATRH